MRHNELGIDQVQHPGAEHLMMVDIRNMQAMALFLQKYDINFDLFSATKEMEKQVFSPTLKSSYFVTCSSNRMLSRCPCVATGNINFTRTYMHDITNFVLFYFVYRPCRDCVRH